MSVFLLKELQSVFFVKINSVNNTFLISIETFYLVLKGDKKKFMKKIRGFVDSELMKTCHEHVNSSS